MLVRIVMSVSKVTPDRTPEQLRSVVRIELIGRYILTGFCCGTSFLGD